ncbi:MAG TPA: hypothetical protein VGL72_14910 [Bryobacteraceae bacterium]|jgi:hypothetical protein
MKLFQMLSAAFFALALSAWLGRADLHTDDTGILVGLIGLGSLLVAMVEPRKPWIWGMVVPAGIITVEAWSHHGVLGIAAFTIAVATAGSYLGAFVRGRVSAV